MGEKKEAEMLIYPPARFHVLTRMWMAVYFSECNGTE